MEDQYLIPGEAIFIDETDSSGQFLVPGEVFIDSEDGTPTPPGPGGRRRPVIIACG